MKTFLYKARKSLFPCFLITISIGWTYAFSLFSSYIQDWFSISKTAVQFIFCLNILFLGSGAATFGALVEKNIKIAAWLSTFLLFIGLCFSGLAIYLKNIWLLYLGCGVLCGIAEGIGYVTPVKNLLLFFNKSKHKALVMAISIVSFGLGSSICSYIFKYAFPYFGIENIFFFFACIYLIFMSIGSIMIDKPRFIKNTIKKQKAKKYSIGKYLCDPYFLQCWLFMFLNISMGLIIIGQCAGILATIGLTTNTIIFIMMLCGFANGGGRLLFPAISDYFGKRIDTWICALILEIIALSLILINIQFTPIAFIIINMGYGCGFALAPAVLLERYGKSELSFCHGLVLSAWGISSLFAFTISIIAFSVFNLNYITLFMVLIIIYILNLINTLILRFKNKGK
jgi:OFA family oxalate/formate antiporter-like MFS transporter